MINSKISSKRLSEINNFPVTFDKDSPKLSPAQIAKLKPIGADYWTVKPVKKAISIKIDADVLEALKSSGKGYQTKINAILREAVFGSKDKVIS